MRANATLKILLVLAMLAGGCATVHPPAHITWPQIVYLADYGVHSSVILPTPDGGFVEYAFGDWGYAVENHDWPWDAFGALVLSHRSAFGRRFLTAAPSGMPAIPPDATPRVKKLTSLIVETSDVIRVTKELDDRFKSGLSQPILNPHNGNSFVADSVHYSAINNCNNLTADCLRELGCKVEGWVVLSEFDAKKPPGDPQASSVDPLHAVTSP